ncbi:SCO family protein [Thiolinea disciformis]|uniref:SCO family protein n=1 Tax=Thiolinea disciformis TaxID=125614 RepID=UPI000371C732|nr:SCO family protein [Thiolinea disciformis]
MNYFKVLVFSLMLLWTTNSWSKPLGGDFSLTDQEGQRFQLEQLRGKVVLLFFGFTHCPSVCPDSLAKIKVALQTAPKEQVAAVFVSVDPERDTVERIRAYIEPFGGQFTALTGSATELQPVLESYQIRVKSMKKSPNDQKYMIDHTADIYVLDRMGKIVGLVPYGLPTEHLQKVLSEQIEPSKLSDVLETTNALVDWRVTNLQGEPQTLAPFKGKAMVINFWASWCPPCREELPSLNQAQALLRTTTIQMLAVNIGDKPAAAQQFLADYPINFTVWLDEDATSFKAWALQGLPTTLLIQSDGLVKERIVGERNWSDTALLEKIQSLEQP